MNQYIIIDIEEGVKMGRKKKEDNKDEVVVLEKIEKTTYICY